MFYDIKTIDCSSLFSSNNYSIIFWNTKCRFSSPHYDAIQRFEYAVNILAFVLGGK